MYTGSLQRRRAVRVRLVELMQVLRIRPCQVIQNIMQLIRESVCVFLLLVGSQVRGQTRLRFCLIIGRVGMGRVLFWIATCTRPWSVLAYAVACGVGSVEASRVMDTCRRGS